jgi:hypothetical protein
VLVHYCLAENKEVKVDSNLREKAKPSLPKEPQLVYLCLTENKEVKAGLNPREKAKPNLPRKHELGHC